MRRFASWLWRMACLLARDVYEFGVPPVEEEPDGRRGFEVRKAERPGE